MENKTTADLIDNVRQHLDGVESRAMVLTIVDDGTMMRLHCDPLSFNNGRIPDALRLIQSHFAEPPKAEPEPLPVADLFDLIKDATGPQS